MSQPLFRINVRKGKKGDRKKMTNKQFTEISNKLDMLTRLLALNLLPGKKQQEQIILLNRVGLQPKEIAEMLDTTPNTVRVTLSKIRKNKK